jgi:hypothetical protein
MSPGVNGSLHGDEGDDLGKGLAADLVFERLEDRSGVVGVTVHRVRGCPAFKPLHDQTDADFLYEEQFAFELDDGAGDGVEGLGHRRFLIRVSKVTLGCGGVGAGRSIGVAVKK